MGKAEGSWSGMREYLEREMLAPALRGRVRYSRSTAVGMDGCGFFEVILDGRCFKRFSWETVNSYFIAEGLAPKPSPMCVHDYWSSFWDLMEKNPMDRRTEYTDGEFAEALKEYRMKGIGESVRSENPIVLMFALFDRRIGKRTLERLRAEMPGKPEWIREAYRFVLHARFGR